MVSERVLAERAQINVRGLPALDTHSTSENGCSRQTNVKPIPIHMAGRFLATTLEVQHPRSSHS